MTIQRTPLQLVREARQIGADYGLLVVEKGADFHVFRKMPTKNVHVAKCGTPQGLHRTVRRLTGWR